MKKYNYIASAKRTLKIESDSIKSISNQLIENKIDPIFPSMNLNEIEMNTFLLSKWINN